MTARIYKPARSAMQSGKSKDVWLLDYEPETPPTPEPLMGWTASADLNQQLRLVFDSKEAAIAYAERNGIAYEPADQAPLHRRCRYAPHKRWRLPCYRTHPSAAGSYRQRPSSPSAARA